MHANPQSPSAHMGSSATVTSTKTKRSQMLQMYYVGGITKSNPSPSQLSLAKDARGRAACTLNVCCVGTSSARLSTLLVKKEKKKKKY